MALLFGQSKIHRARADDLLASPGGKDNRAQLVTPVWVAIRQEVAGATWGICWNISALYWEQHNAAPDKHKKRESVERCLLTVRRLITPIF